MEAKQISTGSDEFGVMLNVNEHTEQWGAWRAYFMKIKAPFAFMTQRAREDFFTKRGFEKGYQFPADWPHEFDGDQTVVVDNEAGKRYLEIVKRWDERSDNLTPEQRKAVVSKALHRGTF